MTLILYFVLVSTRTPRPVPMIPSSFDEANLNHCGPRPSVPATVFRVGPAVPYAAREAVHELAHVDAQLAADVDVRLLRGGQHVVRREQQLATACALEGS